MNKKIADLALKGLITGSLAFGMVGCGDSADTGNTGNSGSNTASTEKYSDVHECAGKNTCKGLGGCHVTAEKLSELATAAGVAEADMGQPHDCAGLNACKGLGGCKVTAEKFAELKAKQDTAPN